ncbi:hypothetical protein GOBAR_AA25329 [Gossypium barbadense]|uniref:Uncharacterized protein n=1 Tax=Gossypium barbadense TaxID=3634 RepID=A0A2P5WW77_GOSBA|nr:hypothetical protein GOBAR_AA25329 [Gossypium barbadense]
MQVKEERAIQNTHLMDEEGLVTPEPEPRQEIVVSKGKGEVDHNDQKQCKKQGSKSTHDPCSSNDQGPIYEERRLRVEELDEWQRHKPRTHDKPKPRHDELNISPNQLKVGDKVLLDAADPRIATSEPNGEIPLTVLSIFPYGTVEVIHAKFDGKAHGRALGCVHTTGGNTAMRYGRMETEQKCFPKTGFDMLPWPCDMAVGKPGKLIWAYTARARRLWSSPSKHHGRAPTYTGRAPKLEKVLHDYHVLPDHHINPFVGHGGCGTQRLPPPEYPPPILSLPWPINLHNSNSRIPFIIQEVSLLSLSYDLISI